MHLLKTWFGIFVVNEENDVVDYTLFPKEKILDRFLSGMETEQIETERMCRIPLVDLAIRSSFVDSEKEYFGLLHDFGIDLARHQIEASFTEDQLIIQAIKTLDDLDDITNLLSERLRELGSLGSLYPLGRNEDLLEDLAVSRLNLKEKRDLLEDYIEEKMHSTAPNISSLAGPLLGARLILLAGGLENLSKMPSSTIQVLGTSKALFRHLEKGTPPPKHGIIFRHPLIHGAPPWQRGKISRVFSSKLSIAARIDCYSGKLNEELSKDLQRRVGEIRLVYPEAPKKEVDQTSMKL